MVTVVTHSSGSNRSSTSSSRSNSSCGSLPCFLFSLRPDVGPKPKHHKKHSGLVYPPGNEQYVLSLMLTQIVLMLKSFLFDAYKVF